MNNKYLFQELLKHRILVLEGKITEMDPDIIIPHLLFLDEKSHDDITLCIDSHGGSVRAGFAIIDTMNFIKSDVRTVCINEAESMAAVILASGAKGKRYSFKDADIMIHQISTPEINVTEQNVDIQYKDMQRTEKQLYEILCKATHKTYAGISKLCEKDYWMTAEQAKKLGIIDEIVTDMTPFLCETSVKEKEEK